MSAIDISTPKTTLNTGVLQLQNGVAMDSTLRNVADQSNTISPLKLSTASVQVTSILQITTNEDPYIDAEDGAGNNRFTIGRAPSSQVVNVDFASNPTGGTNMVGGIRTYTDGVNLAQVMSFRKDGNVGINNTSPSYTVDIGGILRVCSNGSVNDSSLIFKSFFTSAGIGQISFPNELVMTQGAINSTNTLLKVNYQGNLYLQNNLATFLPSGNIGFGTISPSARTHIVGTGSTSATTSLLVQNSGGSNLLQMRDDGVMLVGPSDAMRTGTINSIYYLDLGRVVVRNGDALENASMSIGTNTTANSSAVLDLVSTFRGFLPPRMTNAQRAAIASPAVGLMVYCTDAVEGLYIYKSTGWTFVI